MNRREWNDDHYAWGNGRHQRIDGIWYRIENNVIVDRGQYRHDLEERANIRRLTKSTNPEGGE